MMSDYSELKKLAEGCRDEVIRSHGWVGMIEDADLLGRDEEFLKQCSPEAVIGLIANRDALAAQRDELMQARNGLVENNDALHMQLAKLRAQRDEGLAREAELQKKLDVALRWQETVREYSPLVAERDALQQRLAEAEKRMGDAADLLRRAKHMVPVLQYNWHANTDALLASPGCADGEKS